jgi:elongation factor Ts
MEITAKMVKELRAMTEAGVMACKKALVEAEGDFDKATEIIRQQGMAKAAKKAERVTNEGMIAHYVHAGAKVASLVEVACETDFVAATDAFQALTHDLAMQVVATAPKYVSPSDVPETDLEKVKAEFAAEMEDQNKPPQIMERIIEGKLAKFYQTSCLLEQPFIKDGDVTVGEMVKATIGKLGENIVVKRFARLQLGETN